jgi:hypothetical protein
MLRADTNAFVLNAICVIEQDLQNDSLITWSYPSVDKYVPSNVVIQRCSLKNPTIAGAIEEGIQKHFSFSKYEQSWLYTTMQQVTDKTLRAFAIVLIAKDFNPEKYQAMTSYFAQVYAQNNFSTIKLVEIFLSIFGTGKHQEFVSAAFDENKAKLGGIGLQPVLKIFGPEQGALIWAAMLLKKRIIVVSEHLEDLMQITRALPCLMWHRQQWDILRPLVNFSNEAEVADLKSSAIYIAGSLESNVKSDTKLYDVLLDVSSQRVAFAEHVRDDFKPTKLHQEIAKIIANPEVQNSQQLIKAIHLKTKDIIGKLQTLKEQSNGELSLDHIKELKQSAEMEKFLYNIGLAENLIKV